MAFTLQDIHAQQSDIIGLLRSQNELLLKIDTRLYEYSPLSCEIRNEVAAFIDEATGGSSALT